MALHKADAARRTPSTEDLEAAIVNAMRDLSDRHKSMERERDRLEERLRVLRLSLRAAT